MLFISKKTKIIVGISIVFVAIFVVLFFLPTGKVAYTVTEPVDLQSRVLISGKMVKTLQGHLYAIGVGEEPVRLLKKLWLDWYDDNVSFEEVDNIDTSANENNGMTKQLAVGLAFDYAGNKKTMWSGSGVNVVSVVPQSPAQVEAGLKPGDIIVSINGTEVDNAVDAERIILDKGIGSILKMKVRSAGIDSVRSLRTREVEADQMTISNIGARLDTLGLQVTPPKDVRINAGGIGPAGGLAYLLFVYDATANTDLLLGRSVAAVGILKPNGVVNPVDHVRQRAIAVQERGIELMIVPNLNLAEAKSGIESACSKDVRCARVIPIANAKEAIEALEEKTKNSSD